ncbi:alpha/beta fold hydrolase [Erythrobacter sp. SD-21]|uniref:alpha/beta fold hydrolase n=1 Tax=Erythrobacter sp. SD-21 TaxID=161528 RepID=UPI000153F96C|nr:alpha/beta hydrolase [Erythrobacter sp. SD-21]EDL49672.1 predicted hydrolase [Erythrobacter sp. SD-21]
MTDIRFYEMPDGRRIAFRHHEGAGPTLVFLPGYMSDMDGGKASALMDWAKAQGRACLLLDYSGCGRSDGDFADGTPSKWREEVLALIEAQVEGDVVVIGSSMGGWLMLLVGLSLGERVAGLIGIAAAPDFTEWGYDTDQKAQMEAGETVFENNPYGPEPTPTHAGFFADGQAQRLLGTDIAIDAPVRLLHGQRDADVPFEISQRLADALRSDAVQVSFVKDGDHRLSRPQDIALLLRTVDGLLKDRETA